MNIFEQIFNPELYNEEKTIRGIQNVYTPLDKIEETTDFKFSSMIISETKEIGILFNFEFIENLLKNLNSNYINNIKITFFYDSEFDSDEAKFICYKYNFNNIEYISIEDFAKSKNIKDLEKVMAQKKFDIVFSNPPYGDGSNLHIKIIYNLLKNNCSKYYIFVHPAAWLYTLKDNKSFKKLKQLNQLVSVYMFWANDIFNIRKCLPCCISIFSNTISNFVKIYDNAIYNNFSYIENINNISIYGNNLEKAKNIISLINKKHYLSILNNITSLNNRTDFSVKLPLFQGDAYNKNIHKNFKDFFFGFFFSLILKNPKKSTNYADKNNKDHLCWSFNSENEQINFLNYLKTKLVRFLYSYYKSSMNVNRGELKLIPWLDFTQEWNDAKLCKEFGISEELWKYIDNFILDYYDDYKSGFENK